MRYYKTEPAEQETTINILYKEQIIRIYSSRVETIEKLTKKIGEPDHRYKRSKTYWSGACWKIQFADIERVKEILNKEIILDDNVKVERKPEDNKTNEKNDFYQISML